MRGEELMHEFVEEYGLVVALGLLGLIIIGAFMKIYYSLT